MMCTSVSAALVLIWTVGTVGPPYPVGYRYDGPEPASECGIFQLRTSTPIIERPVVIGQEEWALLAAPAIPGEPDLLVRAYCRNEAGSTCSVKVRCLDSEGDCQRKCGDINYDHRISIADFALARKIVAGNSKWTSQEPWCDVNGDQLCTLADFAQIRHAVAAHDTSSLIQQCPGRNP